MSHDEEVLRLTEEVARHRAVTSMIAGVTHDLATPLGIMNQAASIIADNVREKTIGNLAKDDEARETLEDVAEAAKLILDSAARARALLTAFKNLAVRGVNERRESVDIEALVREVVGLYKYRARESALEIVIDGLASGDRTWTSYPGHLSRILLNLLSNIDRYAYPDGGGRVDVKLGATPSEFTVSVIDHGAGMTAEHAERAFEPFFTTGQDRGGTGLGLAIVHELVTKQLEGSITLTSVVGQGTRLDLSLPRSVTNAAEKETKA